MVLYEDPKVRDIKSKLKKIRMVSGYTQESLAKVSGVNIKSIASYEQNPEKLNAASAGTVYKLALALGCEMEDIINKDMISED